MSYNASDIEVLSGLEPVRRRPGMYTDTSRPNHLAHEVVDNSVDEALAGHAKQIDVVLHMWSKKTQIWIDIIGLVFFLFPFALSVIYLSWPLFVTASGARLDRVAVYRLIKRLSRAAGLPYKLSPHGLRRTAGHGSVSKAFFIGQTTTRTLSP